jgi:hypothetical protein
VPDDFLVENSSDICNNEETIVVLFVSSFHQLKLESKQILGMQLEQNKSYVVKSCEVSKSSGGAGNAKSCKLVIRFDCSGVLFVLGNTWVLSAVVYSASLRLVL